MKIVVYTAIIGGIDRLWSALPNDNVEHIAFVDAKKHEVGLWGGSPPSILAETREMTALPTVWKQRVVEPQWGNRRTARHYKTLPHRYLPDADVWVWVDGNVRLRMHPAEFVKRHGRKPLATLKHPERGCLYKEAQFCRRYHKDKAEVIDKQIARYREAGMPPVWGLAETRVMVRYNTADVVGLGEDWWREIERGIFDIETVKKVNADLIATIQESIQIAQEGHRRRVEAEGEMERLEGELKQALTSTQEVQRRIEE